MCLFFERYFKNSFVVIEIQFDTRISICFNERNNSFLFGHFGISKDMTQDQF